MTENNKETDESISFLSRSEQEAKRIPQSALNRGTESLKGEVRRVQNQGKRVEDYRPRK